MAARAAGRSGAIRTLLLDLDGTLAPIVSTPEAARVPERTRAALRELIRLGWSVAVVSGRPVRQVRSMIPLRGIRAFGSHGLEGSWDGAGKQIVTAEVRRRLARLAREGGTLTASVEGARLERKPAGLAFHDRGVPAELLKGWRQSLRRWLRSQELDGLETISGHRVLEIRVRGIHKGRVARELLDRVPLARRPDHSLVAVGDDRTDEDLFREIRGAGLSVRIGRAGIKTAASHRLPSTFAVQRFLLRLARMDPAASRDR